MAFKGLSHKVVQKYMETPAGKPPRGVKPNFENPPSLKSVLIAVTAVGQVLSTLFVMMRIYTRHFVLRRLWWDDCQ